MAGPGLDEDLSRRRSRHRRRKCMGNCNRTMGPPLAGARGGEFRRQRVRGNSECGGDSIANPGDCAQISRACASAVRSLRAAIAGLVELWLEQRSLRCGLPRRKTVRLVGLVAHGIGMEPAPPHLHSTGRERNAARARARGFNSWARRTRRCRRWLLRLVDRRLQNGAATRFQFARAKKESVARREVPQTTYRWARRAARIVEIAGSSHALEWLPQLVVVTYTNRAADEMQQRTRQQILEAGFPLEVVEAFNRAFFGTIHSFCVKLLAGHGHHLGLPANLELITDDDDLWNQFVQQQTTIGRSLSAENRRVLLRHVQARQLMELARKCEVDLSATEPDAPCPDTSFEEVYSAVGKGQTTRTIPKAKAELKRWEQRWRETGEFVPWPPCASSAKDFVRRWRDAFHPLRDWVNACALCVAAEMQRAYRDFRLERGVVKYADQVDLAAELMRQPNVASRIREKNYRVILDEAQDSDPQQFLVLLEIVRPPEAAGIWRDNHQLPPRPGHFCMVGDFQQSIYRDPADLARYRELHKSLIQDRAAEELKFSVTFRLDQAQLDFVNETFPAILNNCDGQVPFVELNSRADILPGQIVRLDLGSEFELAKSESQRAVLEARELAEWLRDSGLKNLRAGSWRQVAILCPRKAWLRPLRDALLAVGLPAELQSESDREAENPAYAWLTALLVIMVDPNANYEVVGVLREIFGLSDDELARFAQTDGTCFQIAERASGRGTVPDTLNLLARIRATTAQQPLFSAVQEIARMTQLRERLRSLPPSEFGDLPTELDKLLSAAAASEARALSLSDFARNLQTRYNAIRETHPSPADAIQLITAHKAKGSEWQAVI